MTILDAVSEIMLGAGQSRVSALDAGGVNGTSFQADAEHLLRKHMLEVQSMKWHYNWRVNVDLSTDTNGVATVPTGTTTIDTERDSAATDVTQLGDRLLDRENNTTNLGESSTIKVEYTLAYQFGCIPIPIQIYIVKCATIDMIFRVGRNDLLQNAYADRQKAYVRAVQFDTESADWNMMGETDSARTMGRLDQIGRFGSVYGAW